MYYYLKCFYFYSLFGFILESDMFKINNSNHHSGIFYGPLTEVYGFGVVALILVDKFFLKKLKINKILKLVITFILACITLTLVEYIGGHFLHILFNIDMWNYTKKAFNCGKYICLELALIWGILGTLFIYFVKDYLDKFIKLISNNAIKCILILNIIDGIITLCTK